ncbi:MAG: hypothetical protein R2700_05610 [Solirubrobacterales bacterium]
MRVELFTNIGPVPYTESQRDQWRDRTLGRQWMQRYEAELPLYFNAECRRFVEKNGQVKRAFGFFETLGAIVLYHATGYLPLDSTSSFVFPVKEENAVVEGLMAPNLLRLIRNHSTELGNTQAPDTLMYKPNLKDWFFCDSKGPTDSLDKNPNQRKKFEQIAEMSGKPVRLLHFKSMG